MRKLSGWILAVLVLGSTGCYHATINTGRQPSGQTIERPWAHAFLGGLVPPSVTETASQCPSGVARVETQLSFLNMLANLITFSIYSPMTIEVQCASASSPDAPDGADVVKAGPQDAEAAVREAVKRSADTGEAVWLDLR